MKSFIKVEQFLLPKQYRKYGWILLFGGIPFVLFVFSIIIFQVDSQEFANYWDEFGGYLLHVPISLGLFWLLFSQEKEEDEFYQLLRLKSTFHGIRFIFIAVLMLPVFSFLISLLFSYELKMIDLGGPLAVVSLLLAYANGSYWILKNKSMNEE